MTSKIPPALSQVIQTPEEGSLILLTGVQNATATWLVTRYLYALLSNTTDRQHDEPQSSVVLCSYLRDFSFWQGEARRLGLDLSKLQAQNRFAFVDGLTSLFSAPEQTSRAPSIKSQAPLSTRSPLPTRTPIPARAPPSSTSTAAPMSAAANDPPASTSSHPSSSSLSDPALTTLLQTLTSLIPTLSNGPSTPPILLLDTPSILFSSTSHQSLLSTIMTLRTRFHAVILSVPADGALLAASPLSSFNPSNQWGEHDRRTLTQLDAENAAFLVGIAYMSDLVAGCRALETGVAGDVSGVLRISSGGGYTLGTGGDSQGTSDKRSDYKTSNIEGSEDRGRSGGEGEWLYFIGGDGSVEVWERGAGS